MQQAWDAIQALDGCRLGGGEISPAIFSTVFQGTMGKDQRRELGAHYTSEENILKLIRPLFLDALWKEFEQAKTDLTSLDRLHDKLSQLKFLDPACGCGNFLIMTYRELRRLELEILKIKASLQKLPDIAALLKVGIGQFYGIEYEKFPCQIAQAGLLLMDYQMNCALSEELGQPIVRPPLRPSATIIHGNALRMDWESAVPKNELAYILGNPPFVGASMMSAEQKADSAAVFGKIKLSKSMDYVGAWYHKAAAAIQGTAIRVAFVSTNSITQGEQVAPLWGKMFGEYGIHIDFAYRAFKWASDEKGRAAVHCVIIGFSGGRVQTDQAIYNSDGTKTAAANINAYLVDAPNVLIASRSKPICDVPPMVYGNKPSDGGNLILSAEEKDALIASEPEAARFIKPYIGAVEFINGQERYCLWLKGVPNKALKNFPKIQERIKRVRDFRLKSTAKPTVDKAETPSLFFSITQPDKQYLAIPEVSSENRKYVPIDYLSPDIIASNKLCIVPNATLYHFGILTSNVHMAWTRVVGGRLGMSYQYSKAVVYNNFPWPEAEKKQQAEIAAFAQAVLDARAEYPESTFAEMYGNHSMPSHPGLVVAHQNLDRAVMKLYRFPTGMVEAEIVAALMERYQKLTAS